VQALSFPEYETPIGREIRQALDGAREFTPDVMQLLYVANRWSSSRDRPVARRRRLCRLRSLLRLVDRVRRSPGSRSRVVIGDSAVAPEGRHHGSARHRARNCCAA
jgi:hypothetical protein